MALDHGCGGHSEIVVDLHSIPTGGMVFDDNNLDTAEVIDEEVADIDEDDDDDTEVEDLDLSVDVIDESELEVSEEEN